MIFHDNFMTISWNLVALKSHENPIIFLAAELSIFQRKGIKPSSSLQAVLSEF